jgi:DNA polymerase-3 subunit delta'
MQSTIILGNPKNCNEKLNEIIKQQKISKFDVTVITSEKTIGIPDIKNLQKNIYLKPLRSDQKAVVLEAFLGATIEAQNAFLKILEEPPQNTIIFILLQSLDFVLPTVSSRCNVINLKQQYKPEENEKEEYLKLLDQIKDKTINPLIIAQDHGKDKETALFFLEKLISVLETNLVKNPTQGKILKNLQKSYTLIKTTNTNVRFALENLFLNL